MRDQPMCVTAQLTGAGFVGVVEVTRTPDCVRLRGRHVDPLLPLISLAVWALLLLVGLASMSSARFWDGVTLVLASVVGYALSQLGLRLAATARTIEFRAGDIAGLRLSSPFRLSHLLLMSDPLGFLVALSDVAVVFVAPTLSPGRNARYVLRYRERGDSARLLEILGGVAAPAGQSN
ncbi:MAG: hypothetical protein Q7W30_02965 [Coriobacteriia bacterium]|nr:hypothetical protein [Coriobacteriia bacterium]